MTELYPEQDFNAVRETALGFEYDATSETWRSAAGADVHKAPVNAKTSLPLRQSRAIALDTDAPAIACAKSSPVMEAL